MERANHWHTGSSSRTNRAISEEEGVLNVEHIKGSHGLIEGGSIGFGDRCLHAINNMIHTRNRELIEEDCLSWEWRISRRGHKDRKADVVRQCVNESPSRDYGPVKG